MIKLFLEDHRDELSGLPVYVGFSGGADSTALLLGMQQAGLTFTAVHFEHGIRGKASQEDADWCQKFCQERNIQFLRYDLHVLSNMQNGESTEAAARRMRLEIWQQLCTGNRAAIFLAHHADDNLENLFLRLARGGNASGLTGLRSMRSFGNALLCRPLLHCHKTEIVKYLNKQGISDWRQDATNDNDIYRRNAVRLKILPEWKRIFGNTEGLERTLDALSEDADCLDKQACTLIGDERTVKNLNFWQKLHPAIFARCLRIWINQSTGLGNAPISRATILRLRKEICEFSSEGKCIPLEDGLQMQISSSGLVLTRKNEKTPTFAERILTLPTETACDLPELGRRLALSDYPLPNAICHERFSKNFLLQPGAALKVRAWQFGDRIQPFGVEYQRKLQDIFTDAKISGLERLKFPVIEFNGNIIWIPQLRRAEHGRVQDNEECVVLNWMDLDTTKEQHHE